MDRRTLLLVAVFLAGPPAFAEDARVELSGFAGWTSSEGVKGPAVYVPGAGTFTGIEPADSFSWGMSAAFHVSDNVALEFLFDRQESQLSVLGTETLVVGDMSVENYHGVIAYHFAPRGARVRPFVLGGLGFTRYSQLTFSAADQPRNTGGDTRFSTSWGAGVKLWPGRSVGIRLQGRWTPTYIKSNTSGWWCDPYWGCYVISEAQYANQFELAAGISLRF